MKIDTMKIDSDNVTVRGVPKNCEASGKRLCPRCHVAKTLANGTRKNVPVLPKSVVDRLHVLKGCFGWERFSL